MASFSDLPNELVEDILSYLAQADLYKVSRVRGTLYTLAIPLLYRYVDLYIPPGNTVPRIDRFCFNIINDRSLAARVETIRFGLRPDEGVKEGQRWLPQDKHFDDTLMFSQAMDAMSNETLITAGDYLRDAIGMREYSAYAALIILTLPSLRTLHLADYKGATIDQLHTILRNLNPGALWNRRHASEALVERLSLIKKVVVNVDCHSGLVYRKEGLGRASLDHLLNLSGIETLELSIPDGQMAGWAQLGRTQRQLVNTIRPTNLTSVVIRHSGPILLILLPLLSCTPQLRALTYDLFYDCNENEFRDERMMDLAAWSDAIKQVKDTLEILALSIEYCDRELYAFQQPRIGDKLFGYLDLTYLEQLHTLEVPFPFLTGDTEFSIMNSTDIYPMFPPNLRHLSLRPDLSHAQFPFPFDTSILPSGLTFVESQSEMKHLTNARMDVSYMFQATLVLLDFAPQLESISVWQPTDPSLSWFDGQITDFATTCKNKAITGKILVPTLIRSKKQSNWNAVKETTVFDRSQPDQGRVDKVLRGETRGVPLGLAAQYHLHALRSNRVRTLK